jgi:hypothetical protein
LKALGYDDGESETILALREYQITQDNVKIQTDNVRLNFLRYAYDEAQASAKLSELGIPILKVRNLVMMMVRDRDKATPDFPITTLENMVKSGTMPEDVAERYLASQGWLPEQRFYLLNWWLGRRIAAMAQE